MAHYIFERNNGYGDYDYIYNFETMEITDYPEYAAQIDDHYLGYIDLPYLNHMGFYPVGITRYALRINPMLLFMPRVRGYRPARMPAAPRARGVAPRPMPGRPVPPPRAPHPVPPHAPAPHAPHPAPQVNRPLPGQPVPGVPGRGPVGPVGGPTGPMGGPLGPGDKGPGRGPGRR